MSTNNADKIPLWSIAAPAIAAALAGLIFAHILPESVPVLALAAIALGTCVFAAVHHAEMLALKVGEPMGSIILAVAVTVLEVGLIVSIMLSGANGSEMVARDTVFSAIMIVLNGVIGLSLVLGARRHHEQAFQVNATSAALGVLGTLTTIVFILPAFVKAGASLQFSTVQVMGVGIVCLALYAIFVFVQTIKHRDYFMEVASAESDGNDHPHRVPSSRETVASIVLLPLSLLLVILLAKVLSHPLDDAVEAAGLPHAVVGVVIAAVVLLPEGIASVRAALLNRLQNSVNLVLGSALASIGMTIPVVAALAVLTARPLTLGLEPSSMVLLILTLFVSTLTLGTGRTTTLHGAIHLGIFVMFLLIAAVP
ncbi:ionic transporter y4hA [Mesorhizobium sp. B2-1-3A]|uniref:calcium:proton antiporter n=1 Tax=Mesorhizobium sp. B2-1-3A TaxID=2589971 RepID=UPI00112E5337|nr:ionic transporter y4hA [Mesorhizobium sp. B2-1-3A]TPM90917.1 ionic transporter y4hA [Mesorhizobium sp. B2-1-3A]